MNTLCFLTIEAVRKIAGAALTSTSFAPAALAFIDAGDAAAMAMLAVIFVVLVGPMFTQAFLWAARQPCVRRLAAWVVWFGIRWLLWHMILWLMYPQPLG